MAKEILLYDEIGPAYYGLHDAQWMIQQLTDAGGADVDLRINSRGGDVFEAQAIVGALQRYQGKITAYVDSLAASAASLVMLAAPKITIAKGAMIMIHNAWSLTAGNAAELRKRADLLDKVDESIVGMYRDRTKQNEAKLREMMAAETWMSADEAVANGFADSIGPSVAVKAQIPEGMFAKTPAEFIVAKTHQSARVAAAAIARRLALARASG